MEIVYDNGGLPAGDQALAGPARRQAGRRELCQPRPWRPRQVARPDLAADPPLAYSVPIRGAGHRSLSPC